MLNCRRSRDFSNIERRSARSTQVGLMLAERVPPSGRSFQVGRNRVFSICAVFTVPLIGFGPSLSALDFFGASREDRAGCAEKIF